MASVPTPHNAAKSGDIAGTVIMPGDPLRAKFIAETFLENAVQYNAVRGMYGYTGDYKGKRVSVQGSGMGMPSMGIYSWELYNFYGVEDIIRVGTAGAIADGLSVGNVIVALGACTDSNFAAQYGLNGSFAPTASFGLIEKAAAAARELGAEFVAGNVLSTDVFYSADSEALKKWRLMGVLAVEMESAALYMNAACAGKRALSILTVSDCVFTGESASAADRQTAFTQMMEIALETSLNI